MIRDHGALVGLGAGNWLCVLREQPVEDHAGWFARWRWRRAQARLWRGVVRAFDAP